MRRKRKKAFVVTKVKQKLVFVPPKKFWGKKITGIIFLLFGSAVLISSFFYFFLIPNFFQKECPSSSPPAIILEKPTTLFVPRLNLNLVLTEAKVDNNQWLLPLKGAAYLPQKDFFGETGNIIIFGSNNLGVLGKLPLIKKGDQIYLLGENRYLVFEVVEAKTAQPVDESIFTETTEKTLILFSTADYLKGKRFLVRARKITN